MQSRYLLVCAIACMIAGSTAGVHAQFQDPTPGELQMQSDPKWPGADAIGLYLEDTTDDATHLQVVYRRIKVLTEKGKEFATVRMPYMPDQETFVSVEARTIHADGTVVPLTGQPEDLLELQAKKLRLNRIVFTLPSVETGSILEYRVQFRMRPKTVAEPLWTVQQDYPIRKAHFSLHSYVPKDVQVTDRLGNYRGILLYSSHLPDRTYVSYDQSKDIHSLDITDVSPAPREDWMPPRNSCDWRVEFFYTDAISAANFWEHTGESWGAGMGAFLKPSGKLNKVAAGLVSPSDAPEEKARKIYAAVQNLDNTDFSRTKSKAERKKEKLKEIRTVEDVWNNQSGSSDEIALLYVALARAVGLNAFAALVANRDRVTFDAEYMSTSQLDDYIVLVELQGKELNLDPGQKMCPFGELHWKHLDTAGLRMTRGSPALFSIRKAPDAHTSLQRSASLTITPEGEVSGKINLAMNGSEALYWRQRALLNDLDEVKKEFNEALHSDLPEGVHTEFDQFSGLDQPGTNLVAELQVSGTFGAPSGKHFILPTLFFNNRARHNFVSQEKRTTPVDMHYPRAEQDNVTYQLPEGYSVETSPQPIQTAWPNHASFAIECTSAPGTMTVKRTLIYNFTIVNPGDYESLHDFFQKVSIAEQGQVVLSRSAVAKGN